ncbi:MAG: hypothetical protein UU81_C0018G0007 [Microgenomates group bacterium GW2011_GWC1_41_8]|uniref:Uncharacterized protein n=2 Tax=Candidatus Roizmaniibacteriota TaxID=1752723 RepID=A0A0G0ZIE3_9BACT|nr:MAG: hypothetical protein UU14_C0006G0007 [Candidatus Roizmanbacteria bacterium GW2011_GWB1_40_7]KKS21806.1 MAG: hypothetical protein UU78_C0029G0007 [Candidatus Roizmanbacteria bacterium GW2011_GWC2_41_7]KKS23805.1 MAG: hypothetical protein UU81_C0018G0007 [Microgenomates group bacterium GW2011_GWC1_41_8]
MNVVTLMKTAQFIVCVCYLFLISQWHGLNFVHAQESELIIQFAPGTSPYELQKQVTERKDREKSPLGKVKLILGDMTLQFLNKLTPEEKLARLKQIDEQAGVLMSERLFNDTYAEDIYLVRLKANWSVKQAEILYSSIPEIIFAEENSYYTVSL